MQFQDENIMNGVVYALLSGAVAAGGLCSAARCDGADDAAIDVVTVTAQRRSQQAQTVPIAMQIVTGEQASAWAHDNLADLNGSIPGLAVNQTQRTTQPDFTLRGIGSGSTNIGVDSPVGIYVDGVYAGKTGGALMNFNDIERVEVLKGPQATLFGRDSAVGAISIVTKAPSHAYTASADLRLGQYGERHLDAVLNLPFNDATALRFSFVDHKTEGWIRDAATGRRLNGVGDWGTRASLGWDGPSETKVILSWEHESLDQNARPAIGLIPQGLQMVAAPFPANPQTYLNPLTAPVYNDVADNRETRGFDGVTLRVSRPLGWASFDSTTAYRHFNAGNLAGSDGTDKIATYLAIDNLENSSTWQQELKLSGKTDSVDWLTGASLFVERAHQTSRADIYTDTINTLFANQSGGQFPLYSIIGAQLRQAGLPLQLLGNTWREGMMNKETAKSASIYGDAIWHLTPRLNLTTGVRLSHDVKEFNWFNPPRAAPGLDAQLARLPAGVLPNLIAGLDRALSQFGQRYTGTGLTQNIEYNNPLTTQVPLSIKRSWNDASPRAVLDYRWTPDAMVFGSVARGYQPGGFDTQNVAGVYQPETIWNAEVGFKSYFHERQILFNASVFRNKFSNFQALSLIPSASTIPQYRISSSDQSAIGGDIEARWQATRGLRLFAVAEYIDQHYGRYTAPDGLVLDRQPTGTPLWSLMGGADYTQRGMWGGSMLYGLQYAYRGAARCNADAQAQGICLSTPAFTQGLSRQRTDLRLGWQTADGERLHWGATMYVANLFNQRYIGNIDNTALTILGTPAAQITAPRIVGLQLHVSL
jgi:iron complex outermembrane receptor protein